MKTEDNHNIKHDAVERMKTFKYHFYFQSSQILTSVKVLHASTGIVQTMSTCTPVSVNLALQVSIAIQVCLFYLLNCVHIYMIEIRLR